MSCRVETPPKEHFDSAHKERTIDMRQIGTIPFKLAFLGISSLWRGYWRWAGKSRKSKNSEVNFEGLRLMMVTIDDVDLLLVYLLSSGWNLVSESEQTHRCLAHFFLVFSLTSRSRSLHSSHTFLLGLVSGWNITWKRCCPMTNLKVWPCQEIRWSQHD
jgi:hypothetical protein